MKSFLTFVFLSFAPVLSGCGPDFVAGDCVGTPIQIQGVNPAQPCLQLSARVREQDDVLEGKNACSGALAIAGVDGGQGATFAPGAAISYPYPFGTRNLKATVGASAVTITLDQGPTDPSCR
jgi:hypothetical protein